MNLHISSSKPATNDANDTINCKYYTLMNQKKIQSYLTLATTNHSLN